VVRRYEKSPRKLIPLRVSKVRPEINSRSGASMSDDAIDDILRPPRFLKGYTYDGGCGCCGFDSKEAAQQIRQFVLDEVIGEDEKHSNGKKLVTPWVCDDCGTPEEAFTRNELRATQRKKLREPME
jgi:hypothetical protein